MPVAGLCEDSPAPTSFYFGNPRIVIIKKIKTKKIKTKTQKNATKKIIQYVGLGNLPCFLLSLTYFHSWDRHPSTALIVTSFQSTCYITISCYSSTNTQTTCYITISCFSSTNIQTKREHKKKEG